MRFIGVGGLATFTHVAVASIAFQFLATAEMRANFVGFCAAVLVSYMGHSRFTFASVDAHKGQFGRFLFVALTGLGASSAIVWLVNSSGGGFYLSMALVAVLVPMTTFLAMKFWVFSNRDAPALPSATMVFVALAATSAFLVIYWNWPINHDTAWYLVATRKFLDGAKLYVDIIEVNPPLNFYYTIPSLLIADFLGVSDTNGQYLAVAILYLVSLLWSGAILRRVSGLSAMRLNLFFAFMALVYILGAASEIAQRDHLVVLFLSPWVVSYLSTQNKPPSLASSAFAAAGICLKPFFLVFPLALFLRDVWRTRSARPLLYPHYLLMLAIGVGYVVFVKTVHPEYLDEIAPTAVHVYGAFKKSTIGVLSSQFVPLSLGLVALTSMIAIRNAQANIFAIFAIAGFVGYLVQSTGFHYHLIPFFCFVLLGCAWLLLTAEETSLRLLPALMACGLLVLGLSQTGKYQSDYTDEVVHQLKALGPIDSLMAASTLLDPGAPVALRLGIDWVSRYPHNWLYPGAVNTLEETNCAAEPDLCALLQSFADKNRKDNLEDIVLHKPDVIVTDRIVERLVHEPFTWTTFMQADPRFAEVMKDYELVHSTREIDYYQRTAD
nr:GtrA family protein [Aliiroseovarius sp. S1339]